MGFLDKMTEFLVNNKFIGRTWKGIISVFLVIVGILDYYYTQTLTMFPVILIGLGVVYIGSKTKLIPKWAFLTIMILLWVMLFISLYAIISRLLMVI